MIVPTPADGLADRFALPRGTRRAMRWCLTATALAVLLVSGKGTIAQPTQPAIAPSPTREQAPAPAPVAPAISPTLEGYDFGHVVETLSASIDPLESELGASMEVFVQSVEQADELLEQGRTREALERCSTAVDGVLAVREEVLGPMWEGQAYLSEQIAWVRLRLARALEADRNAREQRADERTERMLDRIAARIPEETDPNRRKWLIAQYRTIRDIGRIRQTAARLSPDQRKLWVNVLSVLDEASLAHQQVLMGSEVLFAQFEATAARLKEYQALLETVDGAGDLLDLVRGAQSGERDLSGFGTTMGRLQQKLADFNVTVEAALQGRVADLEAKIARTQQTGPGSAPADVMDSGVVSIEADDELTRRIQRLQTDSPRNEPDGVPTREDPQRSNRP